MELHIPAVHRLPPTPAAGAGRSSRRIALVLLVAGAAALLSACGGGGADVTLGINATVGGQPLTTVFAPGGVGTIDLLAGQSVALDASEPVAWSFTVDGNVLFGSGTTVFVGGLAITETAVSPSRVVIDTSVTGPFVSPVTITLTATSTIDAAQVATIDLVVH